MKTHIRKCSERDLNTLCRIGRETYDDTFASMNTRETMEKYLEEAFNDGKILGELQNRDSRFYLLYCNDDLAGYVKTNEGPAQTDINDPDSLEIERIYVRREFQGRGLGRVLIEHAERLAAEAEKTYTWLGVWEKNDPAVRFYEKLGYKKAGTHSFRMGDEIQSDYIMKKPVNGS